jgi:hypothetical protein
LVASGLRAAITTPRASLVFYLLMLLFAIAHPLSQGIAISSTYQRAALYLATGYRPSVLLFGCEAQFLLLSLCQQPFVESPVTVGTQWNVQSSCL